MTDTMRSVMWIPVAMIGFILMLCPAAVQAQDAPPEYPVIGRPMPEFRLNNVQYYERKTFTPADTKKWIVLDFWDKGCVSCVQSFPKLNELQQEFNDHFQFFLIGKNDRLYNRDIEKVFERYRKRLNLQLSIAYDTVIFRRFRILAVPHVIVITPEKEVYAVTSSNFLTRENMFALIEGKKPPFYRLFHDPDPKAPNKWTYLLREEEMDNRDFLYRSILSKNIGEPGQGSWQIDQYVSKGLYQVSNLSLADLYRVAYFGNVLWTRGQPELYNQCWRYPVLEVKDSSLFSPDYNKVTGLYNYSLSLSRTGVTKAQLMEQMQVELKNYFGFEVTVENRMMPYWRLTATPEAKKKLRTKGGPSSLLDEPTGIIGKNISIDWILIQTARYNGDERFPFIDETGIIDKIDIHITAVMTVMDDVRKALSKHGLVLEKAKKEMKVLVFRDKLN